MDLVGDPTGVTVSSAVLPAGTVDDTTVPLTLTATDFKPSGGERRTAWVATLGQVIDEPVSLENSAQYRKTVVSAATRAATTALVPERDPMPIPDGTDPGPDPEPSEDDMKFYGKHRGVAREVQFDGRIKVEVPSLSLTNLLALPCFPPVPEALMRMPEIGDELWVEFEGGNPDFPIWTGVMRSPQMPQDLDIAVNGTLTLKGMSVELEAHADLNTTATICKVTTPVSVFSGAVNCTHVVASAGVVSPMYTPGAGNVW
jgi:hypothetical protein